MAASSANFSVSSPSHRVNDLKEVHDTPGPVRFLSEWGLLQNQYNFTNLHCKSSCYPKSWVEEIRTSFSITESKV